MVDAVSSAVSLVETSLKLYDTVSAFYQEHAKLPKSVESIRGDLRYVEEAIDTRSRTADRDGNRSWVDDLRRIKLRIEDAVEYYKLEFRDHEDGWRGALPKIGRKWKENTLLGYLEEIQKLISEAKNNVDTYLQQNPGSHVPGAERTSGGNDEDKYDDHPKEDDPVGLETATRDLVRLLIDASRLRVIAISGGPDSSWYNHVLTEAAYNNKKVQEKFDCKAWVKAASHDDAQNLLLAILDQLRAPDQATQNLIEIKHDQLGAPDQATQNLIETKQTLRDFLGKKRYIIVIDGLETTDYWDNVRSAFPDDNTSSRIIVTTIKEKVAQACRKNCKVYSFEETKEDIVQMLISRDKYGARQRVVAISGPDEYGKSIIDEVMRYKVKVEEKFKHLVWITEPHDGNKLLRDILDKLLDAPQNDYMTPKLSDTKLRDSVKALLTGTRYIIVIQGLETTDCWNDVRCAFPDDNTSSRIIVTTTKEEVAQACRKNCKGYSFEATKEDIVQVLISRDKDGAKRRVVAISGPGGCGKSILAEVAYNKVKVEEEFEYQAMITATQDGEKLLRDILEALGHPQNDNTPHNELYRTLRDVLTGKRYIIVIDGLAEAGNYWSDVEQACRPDEETGSRIIVTTANKEVASTCHSNCPVYMMQQYLDKTSAQDLLVWKVFGTERICDDLRKGLNIILETCEYLPLAVANIGNFMKAQGLSDQDWNYAKCDELCKAFSSHVVNKANVSFRGMRHVLNRSYRSLSGNAKACLLSLSSYPNDLEIMDKVIKNHGIKAKPLIRRLLAENLVSPADDLIKECLTPLIEHNFIVPTEFSITGHVKTFRVNRMLPQFIKEKGDQEKYVTRIDIQQDLIVELKSDITRLYLHNSSSSESSGIIEKDYLTHVRLLTFSGKASKTLMCFDDYTFLRVLILENCESMKDENLDTVCSPRMLKYLSIRGNKSLTKLPDGIKKMLLLETLDTRDTTVRMLPMDIILLPKLAHLFGEFNIIFKKRKFGSFKDKVIESCQLETLAGVFIDGSPLFINLLPFMSKLSKVKILHSQAARNDEACKNLVESLNSCFNWEPLSNKRLRSLSFDFGGWELDFLDLHLTIPSYLLSLKLHGNLTVLPNWIRSQCNLDELNLSGSNIGHLSELQCLENLAVLKLTGGDFNEDCFKFEEGWFKGLKRLHLDFPKLPKIVIQNEAMPKLQFLQLSCTNLGGFDGIENLLCLEELILPTDATSAEAVNLLNQVKMLPKRPRISRSGSGKRKFDRSRRFKRP